MHELRVVTADGTTEIIQVNADDDYWTTIGDPVKAILTLTDGSEREIRSIGMNPTAVMGSRSHLIRDEPHAASTGVVRR